MAWDIAMMLLILYYAVSFVENFQCNLSTCSFSHFSLHRAPLQFAVPMRLGFDIDPKHPMLENFFTGCFALDMLINFNTALIGQGGVLIFDRQRIASDYFKMWFWIDFVATFPFEIVTGGGSDDASGGSGAQGAKVGKLGRLGKIFRLLRVFKLLRILKLGRIIRRLKHSTNVNPNWLLLGRTLGIMGFSIHCTACGYWAVVENQPDNMFDRSDCGMGVCDEQWLPPKFIQEGTFNDKYAYAFFWGISVTTGVGWDIIPATSLEVAFSSVMILCGMILYITILGSVTSIVSNIGHAKSIKMARLDAVIRHLTASKASRSLVLKIRGYYDFMWADDAIKESATFDEEVAHLPKSLQLGIFDEMHRDIIGKVPILQPLNAKAVFAIARSWNRLIYLPDDVIAAAGEPVNGVSFVVRGSLAITFKLGMMGNKALTLLDLGQGSFFGEECSEECRKQTALMKLQRGNSVKITQKGVHQGAIATVLDPSCLDGMVKVKLPHQNLGYDSEKYSPEDLVMVNEHGQELAEVMAMESELGLESTDLVVSDATVMKLSTNTLPGRGSAGRKGSGTRSPPSLCLLVPYLRHSALLIVALQF
jgi:hypothetical protein